MERNPSIFRRKSIANFHGQMADAEAAHGGGLKRNLTFIDLTALGIAAIIGAGIFSTIGQAASQGGPATSLLFVFTAIACVFSALCYAQFASAIPISGSAYSYAYTSFGELIAWIIGWDLILEYAIGNIAVAISWSDYFTSALTSFHIPFPSYLTLDYLSASRAADLATSGAELTPAQTVAAQAFAEAPALGSLKLIADVPALTIVVLITALVYIGVRESKWASNAMVALKLLVVMAVIGFGFTAVQTENWIPFAPNGVEGVLKGVAGVFFAYVGFDAISTTAEECKNPQRDLPKAMLWSLAICTVLYVLVALVLTGMVPYTTLGVGDPLAFAFGEVGLGMMSTIVALSAIVALSSVLLVFQLGQPRIWLAMSRDGLIGPIFSRIHKTFRTPSFATIITGLVVAIPALFMNLTEVTDLTSIGTLAAFAIVCGGVLGGPRQEIYQQARFKVPYASSAYILPIGYLVALGAYLYFQFIAETATAFKFTQDYVPIALFWVAFGALSVLGHLRKFSLIPAVGLLSCLFLMSQLGWTNWVRFITWLAVGLIIYFAYSRHHSKLATVPTTN